MDSSHVSLVALFFRAEAFEPYRADRNLTLGITLASMAKILKCAGNDDIITIKADNDPDTVAFMFESPRQTRISHFTLKLMDIDSEHLGIPDTDYKVVIQMPSDEFQRICREMTIMGDTVNISATKEGVKFSVKGDIGSGAIVCKQHDGVDDDSEEDVRIRSEEDISLRFALRYLNLFCKATPLSSRVTLKMSPDVPLVIEYGIAEDAGHLRFYLAPKVSDENDDDPKVDEDGPVTPPTV